jgi:hypothetical protein
MFSNILGRKKEDISEEDADHAELIAKISKMNLTEMRTYIKDRIPDFSSDEDGINAVLNRLIAQDSKTKERYLKSDDMDSKKKKAFDLVLAIAEHKKINLVTIELIQKFIEVYREIISDYDKEHKEIYESRFVDAIKNALININEKAALKNKMDLLGEH